MFLITFQFPSLNKHILKLQKQHLLWTRRTSSLLSFPLYTALVLTLLSTCQATTEILCSVLGPAIQKRCARGGKDPEKGNKDDPRTGKPYEERLRELGMVSFEKRTLKARLYPHVLVFKGWLQRTWRLLFIRSHMEQTAVMGTSYSGENLVGCKRKAFHTENNQQRPRWDPVITERQGPSCSYAGPQSKNKRHCFSICF